jgi:hypothetical protein
MSAGTEALGPQPSGTTSEVHKSQGSDAAAFTGQAIPEGTAATQRGQSPFEGSLGRALAKAPMAAPKALRPAIAKPRGLL